MVFFEKTAFEINIAELAGAIIYAEILKTRINSVLAEINFYVNGDKLLKLLSFFLYKNKLGKEKEINDNTNNYYLRIFLFDRSPYTGVAKPNPPDTVSICPVV